MQKQAKLIVSFVRYHYVSHMILTALFILLAGAILSFRNLDAQGAAKVVEMYGVLSGTLLLTPLFMPESDPEIWQLEQSKAFGMWKLYLGRFAVAVALLAAVMGSFTLRLSMGHSVFDTGLLWRSGYCEALFLGSIGYFAAALTNQAVIGYMASVLYYVANIGGASKLGVFGLYPVMRGETAAWGWLLISAALLTSAAICIRERKR